MNDPEEFPVIPPAEQPAEPPPAPEAPPPAPEAPAPPIEIHQGNGNIPRLSRDLEMGSIPALLIISLSLILYFLVLPGIIAHFDLKWMFERASAKESGTVSSKYPEPKSALSFAIALSMFGALAFGAVAAIAVFVIGCIDRRTRERLEKTLGWMAVRPLPAIHFIDVAAAFAVRWWTGPLYVILLHNIIEIKGKGMLMAYQMVANDMAFASAIIAGFGIACWRARGAHGMLGFWPPWSGKFVSPKRSIWHDIALGVACYPLTLWITAAASGLNWFFVSTRNPHQIEIEIARNPSILGATIFILAGTFGAAIMEETIFRGMLYNSMRRWLGGPAAALGAAFIFALGHGQKSALFPLFALGLIMTWLYDKTGRLIAGMAFHFTNNLVSMVSLLVMYNQ